MNNYEGRSTHLKNNINKHLSKLTRIDEDYYSKFSPSDFIALKTVLADINNILTFKLTISATEWLCDYFKLTEQERVEIIKNIDEAKPNSNGFDIHINNTYKIIAEVKCISPINNGDKFGSAQKNSILEDFRKLQKGKPSVSDTTSYYKFLFLMDLGSRTDKAIEHLLKQKPTEDNKNEIKNTIIKFSDDIKLKDLELEKIYCKQLLVE